MFSSCENKQFVYDHAQFKSIYINLSERIDSITSSDDVDITSCLSFFHDNSVKTDIQHMTNLDNSMQKEQVTTKDSVISKNCHVAMGFIGELLDLSSKSGQLTFDEKQQAIKDVIEIIVMGKDMKNGEF